MNIITRIIFGFLITFSATGCASNQHAMNTSNTNSSIELLYFDGCPNTPPFLESLSAATTKINTSFVSVDLMALPESDIRRGYGSPTILVNGHDLFDMPKPKSPTMSCRIYPGGLPNTDSLIAKLSEITP
tara:strand:- start:1193 stop:1582 length:390 start_codon:yes stop_codon:yes gene_type:complete